MSNKLRIILTAQGKKTVNDFIVNLETERSELIHAGYASEDDEAVIPDIDEIVSDILERVTNDIVKVLYEADYQYANDWKATENSKPHTLRLSSGKDFVLSIRKKERKLIL